MTIPAFCGETPWPSTAVCGSFCLPAPRSTTQYYAVPALHTAEQVGGRAARLSSLLLDEVVSYYTRAARPGGYTTDDPFPLPVGIREIQVTRGQALIIQ